MEKDADGDPHLPAPPPVPENVKPELAEIPQQPERAAIPKYSIIGRRGVGTSGRRIPLLTNHFKVSVNVPDAVFYQYSVCLPCFSLMLSWILPNFDAKSYYAVHIAGFNYVRRQ